MPAEIASLVDRCLLVSMAGSTPSPRFRDWLAEGLGGVLLYQPNICGAQQLKELCDDLRGAGRDLLIAADAEGGDFTPLYPGSASPHPTHLALGALDDPAVTEAVAADIGNDLAQAGLNLNLAPVADVGTDPRNIMVSTRSFGPDPELVARHTAAYTRGLQRTGVAAAVKHFPGIGSCSTESTLAFPVTSGDIGPQLLPFAAAIEAGVAAVLTSHAVYPELDSAPGTLSRPILTGLLRGELGFDGVIIGDSITTAMIVAQVGTSEAAVRAIGAGVDLLCMMGGMSEQRAARDRVIAAVTDGQLTESRVADAAARVTALARARAHPAGVPRQRLDWTADLARRLLYVDTKVPLPDAPYVIEFPGAAHGGAPAAPSLLSVLQELDDRVSGIRLSPNGAGMAHAVRAAPAGRSLLLVARDAHQEPRLRANLETILDLRRDATLIGLGTTDDAWLAPGRYLGTRGSARPNLAAAGRCLLGRL